MLESFLTFHVSFRFISSQCTMHVEVGQCNRTDTHSYLAAEGGEKRREKDSGDYLPPRQGSLRAPGKGLRPLHPYIYERMSQWRGCVKGK